MTSKQIYEATAIELSKVQAPALKLYEFNYFFNQAIRQFVNKVYNVYDVNQQTTDDLRVLKATATLKPEPAEPTGNKAIDYLRGATYFVNMPDDYLHLLNCICLFDVHKRKDCWNQGDVMVVGATKLTADSWSSVVDDVYNRPTKKRPYYYIHNQNKIYADPDPNNPDYNLLTDRNSELPTSLENDPYVVQTVINTKETFADLITFVNDYSGTITDDFHTAYATTCDNLYGNNPALYEIAMGFRSNDGNVEEIKKSFSDAIDANSTYTLTSEHNTSRTFNYVIDNIPTVQSSVEKPAGTRHANTSKVKVEIRCGRDKSNVFELSAVQIDYIKAPQLIRLTQEQLDSDEDISQIMEFPDYVNQEIVNELVNLVMRKVNDPTLQTHMQMTQSIARPTGQQQQPA